MAAGGPPKACDAIHQRQAPSACSSNRAIAQLLHVVVGQPAVPSGLNVMVLFDKSLKVYISFITTSESSPNDRRNNSVGSIVGVCTCTRQPAGRLHRVALTSYRSDNDVNRGNRTYFVKTITSGR